MIKIPEAKKKPHIDDPMCVLSNPHLSSCRRIWHLASQVAGFHRAVPSTTLDKAYMQFWVTIHFFLLFVKLFLQKVHKSAMDF